jgi:hypothetical protein
MIGPVRVAALGGVLLAAALSAPRRASPRHTTARPVSVDVSYFVADSGVVAGF